jgi:hypothetical protein
MLRTLERPLERIVLAASGFVTPGRPFLPLTRTYARAAAGTRRVRALPFATGAAARVWLACHAALIGNGREIQCVLIADINRPLVGVRFDDLLKVWFGPNDVNEPRVIRDKLANVSCVHGCWLVLGTAIRVTGELACNAGQLRETDR